MVQLAIIDKRLAISDKQIGIASQFQQSRYRLRAPIVEKMRECAKLYVRRANQLAGKVGTLTDEYDLSEVGLSADNKFARTIATEALAKRAETLFSPYALVLVAAEAHSEEHREQAIERLRKMGKNCAGLIEPIFK